jgi:hypothetical protein
MRFKKYIYRRRREENQDYTELFVIPAKAGIQRLVEKPLDSGSSPE